MQTQAISFESTAAFSRLALDYLSGKAVFNDFISHSFSADGVEAALMQRMAFSPESRKVLVTTLREQYGKLADKKEIASQIEKLLSPDCFTVVTAHQPNLLSGPAYFIYKIAGAVALSRRLNASHPEKSFVPVYWMGAEDHDLEELNHLHLFGQKLEWNNGLHGPVGRMPLTTLQTVLDQVYELLGEKPEALELKTIIAACFKPEHNWAQATRLFVHTLFGQYGLLVLDGDAPLLKQQFSGVMRAELLERSSEALVLAAGKKLEAAGYSAQIFPRTINLFWIEAGIRERIVFENNRYQLVHGEKSWSEAEMLRALEENPQNFSPNVVLRPLYQEMSLPNVAFIGGGAEVAYWMLLKDVFALHQVPMPVVMLRSSAMYIDRNSLSKMEKLGLSSEDLFQPTEELVLHYLASQEKEVFVMDAELADLENWFDKLASHIEKIDPSLKAAALAEGKKVEGQLRGLEARVKKAQKQRHETGINQIRQLKTKLFPDNHLQERHDNFMNFYLAEGASFIEACCAELDPLSKQFILLQAV